MIDPRFANAGTMLLMPGFSAQPMSMQHHRHRRHQHHKRKVRNDESPISRDESIHKVDYGHYHFPQNYDAQFGSGYGVPYDSTGYAATGPVGFHQQQQHVGGNFGYANQYQGSYYKQGTLSGNPVGQRSKQHRHRRRRHHHPHIETGDTAADGDQGHAVPEQMTGQHSSSIIDNEDQQQRSPAPLAQEEVTEEPVTNRRHRRHHRHRHHHHYGEDADFGQMQQWYQTQGYTSVGADGYGHINDDLIFIERGEHSPHRQGPPPGYEYKGKIEVQGIDGEYRSRSRGQALNVLPSASVPPCVTQPSSFGPCPPGWQPMILTAAPGGPCPPGTLPYTGQAIGAVGGTQTGAGGFGAGGSNGLVGSSGAFTKLGGGLSFPSQCQFIGDYIFGSNISGVGRSSGNGFTTEYQKSTGVTTGEQFRSEQMDERSFGRPTIIEVWQRQSKSATHEKSRSRSRSKPRSRSRSQSQSRSHSHHRSRTPRVGSTFDFERFRNELLTAIERMVPRGGSGSTEIQWVGRDGGTQTQIHPSTAGEAQTKYEKRSETASGEVRVIVQPIQPVFYMPRQTGGTTAAAVSAATATTTTTTTPSVPHQISPVPIIQQQTVAGAPNVVYIPRNVYVPVIKPVFVPRERVIVRPQVIHVARPVLVDRPVPVTQRPVIIDREKPIPVSVSGGGQTVAQGDSSKVVREEYVYRDNLPVAYGGRCAEFAGGINYGYVPTQQEHKYATDSMHEASNIYQAEGSTINENVPNQFLHTQSTCHYETQQHEIDNNFHGSYSNLVGTECPFVTGVNNEYLVQQQQQRQQQQYGISSAHETGSVYQTEGSVTSANVPNQFQHSQKTSHFEVQGGDASGDRSFHQSYLNLTEANNVANINVGQLNQEVLHQTLEQSAQAADIPAHCATQIEVLDTTVNPFWQKTDQSTLMRRYGRPAFEIVHKSDEVEQQLYNELRQRTSSDSIVRSASAASYRSSFGIGINGGGITQY